jgi:S1-C subfamily serine protease
MYNNIYKKTIFRLFILIQLFFLLFFFTSCSSSLSTAEIYNQSIAKVVEIRTTNNNVDYSYASGCFIDKNKIVTNKHVVYNPTTSQNWIHIEYRKYNETNYTEASIEKVYTNSDLATLSVINGNSYFKINERCSVANVCYSIGNPNNLGLSFNSGIVSAFSNITIDGLINKMI